MQPSGWSRLSEEAQSVVCQNLGRKELASVCLVSKTCWISNARQELYYSPLAHYLDFHRLVLLLRTLRSSPGIARFVRDLYNLEICYQRIVDNDHGGVDCSFFSIHRQTNSFSWVVGMIEACSRVQAISLYLELDYFKTLQAPIRSASSTLRRLSIAFDYNAPTQRAFRTWIANIGVENLDDLTLDFEKAIPQELSSSNPSQSLNLLSVKKLGLLGLAADESVVALHSLIPLETSAITSLRLSNMQETRAGLPPDTFQYLHSLSSQLVELDITFQSPYHGEHYYPHYDATSVHILPVPLLFTLPQLQKLRLGGARMSIARLEALQSGSPKLEDLDFAGSIWQKDSSDAGQILSQSQLVEIFRKFSSIKSVDLGWTPCREGHSYASLEQLMWQRDVSFTYEKTYAPGWCPSCGIYHE